MYVWLSRWNVKSLSIGGRLTLLKSILDSVPTYCLSLLKAPTGILTKLQSLKMNIFLGIEVDEKKISRVSWDKVLE